MDNKVFNALYLLIIILIASCLAFVSGFMFGSFPATPNQSPQITDDAANCTVITSLPYTIQASGNYCLTENLTTDGDGIYVMADNVLIDFQGFGIHGSQDPNNIFNGIYAHDRSRINIQNGEITGFLYAIRIGDSAYGRDEPYLTGLHTIQDMEISNSTFRGVAIRGHSNVIQNNIIRNIQGNEFHPDSFAIGIESTGAGALIQGNYIYEIRGNETNDIGEGVGISLSTESSGGVISNNKIINSGIEESNQTNWSGLSRSTWAIWIGGSSSAIIEGNIIHGYAYGIAIGSAATAPSAIKDNTIINYYTAMTLSQSQNHLTFGNLCDGDCEEQIDLPLR